VTRVVTLGVDRYPSRVSARSGSRLDALIAEATVDCYGDDEAVTGFLTMMQDNLVLPFETQILGVEVSVDALKLNRAGEIVAICSRGKHQQPIAVVDLPLPTKAPEGAEWIDAYRRWRR
jgi:hypothetical protein